MYFWVVVFLIMSAVFLAVISKGGSGAEAGSEKLRKFPEVLYSPESAQRNAIRIVTICVVLGFIGGAIMRFSLVQEDFTEEDGVYGKLRLGREEAGIILKNQKVVGGMWLSALAVILTAGAILQRMERTHPRHVASVLILVPGFVIGLFIMAISPDALSEKAAQTAVEDVCLRYFLTGVIVMICSLFCSWICWHSAQNKMKTEVNILAA